MSNFAPKFYDRQTRYPHGDKRSIYHNSWADDGFEGPAIGTIRTCLDCGRREKRLTTNESHTDYTGAGLTPARCSYQEVENGTLRSHSIVSLAYRLLEDGSLEVTLKSTELDYSRRIKFQIGANQPVRGEHLRQSFNDECSIFGVIVPRAKRKHEIRVTCS